MSPGPIDQANNRMQPGLGQGTGSENTLNLVGCGQNNAGRGQGTGPQGLGRVNGTEFGNMTLFSTDDGTMEAPPLNPCWDPDNSTALNTTAWHVHRPGNMTGGNMTEMNLTDVPPPRAWDPAKMKAANQTWCGHDQGYLTRPAQPPQHNQQQAQNQNNSGDRLTDELISLLKARGIS